MTLQNSSVLSKAENNRKNQLNDMNINQFKKNIWVDINCPLSKCILHTFPGLNCDQLKWDGTCHRSMSTKWQLATSHQNHKNESPFHGEPQTDKVHIPATYWIHRNRRNNWLPCTHHANMKCQTGRSGFARTLRQVMSLDCCMYVWQLKEKQEQTFTFPRKPQSSK